MHNKYKHLSKLLSGLFLLPGIVLATPSVDFSIKWDGATDRYRIYARPLSVPSPDRSLTGQVTIKAPYTNQSERFIVDDIISATGTEWSVSGTIHAPNENTSASYLSFMVRFDNPTPYAWQSNQEIELFSFTNQGPCLGSVNLLDASDSFNYPNSKGTNPGNQFTNMGWETPSGVIFQYENHWRQNYGSGADCVSTQTIDLEISSSVDKAQVRVDEPFTFTLTIANNGDRDATDIVVADQLPERLSWQSSTASQGSYDAETGLWQVGTLNKGEQASLAIQVVATKR